MAVGSAQTSVGSSAAVLLAQVPVSAGPGPVGSVLISNGSGAVIYLGGVGVSATTGTALGTSTAITLWLFGGDAIYAITSASTSTVGVLQT